MIQLDNLGLVYQLHDKRLSCKSVYALTDDSIVSLPDDVGRDVVIVGNFGVHPGHLTYFPFQGGKIGGLHALQRGVGGSGGGSTRGHSFGKVATFVSLCR